ncbi:MAG: DUF6504 family protein [Nocardioidaceae bacterium]
MRRYDEPIAVRRGLVAGQEAPEQFLWRGKLWMVREIVCHWVETGAWWEQSGVVALLGIGVGAGPGASASRGADLLGEREVWRVEEARGRVAARAARLPGRASQRLDQAQDPLRPPSGPSGEAPSRQSAVPSFEPSTEAPSDAPSEPLAQSWGYGVFEIGFAWADGQWRMIGSID